MNIKCVTLTIALYALITNGVFAQEMHKLQKANSELKSATQSSEKAKEMMDKNAEKGKSAEAKINAKQKKMSGKAKAEKAKNKEKPPIN